MYTCSGCDRKFFTANAHSLHRAGSYGGPMHRGTKVIGFTKSTRHCLGEAEMLVKGMRQDAKGVWHSSAALETPLLHWKRKENGQEGRTDDG